MEAEDRTAITNRLKRIEGQVRGLIGMIEDERYCVDIVNQVEAVKGALTKVENMVLKVHAHGCVEDALQSGSLKDRRRKFSELIDLFERVGS